jgi:hypothetical protein
MNKAVYPLIILLLCVSRLNTSACTTAVVSGKCTVDGRPLLFKQRDATDFNNRMQLFHDGKYIYMGLCDKKDPKGKEVWGGYNSTGFAIINSASYNLNSSDSSSVKDREGFIMKRALQVCASLKDFEILLDTLAKPMGCNTNFGVIDAHGGAAYYETGNNGYVKFDANDSVIAKRGYLIRTNFCFTGKSDLDKGLSRYYAEKEILLGGYARQILSPEFFLSDVSRSLFHGLTHVNLYNQMPENDITPFFVPFRDYILRYSTSSALVIQGVSQGESPSQSVCWTVLGSPLTSVAIPLWIIPSGNLPLILEADTDGNAPLCKWALTLKESLFPIHSGEGPDYLDLGKLINKRKNGIMQRTLPIQDSILHRGIAMQERFRKNKSINPEEINAFYNWVNQYVTDFYTHSFSPYDKSPASPRPGTM